MIYVSFCVCVYISCVWVYILFVFQLYHFTHRFCWNMSSSGGVHCPEFVTRSVSESGGSALVMICLWPVMIISGPAPPNKRLPTPPLRSCRPAGATGYLGLSSRFSFLIPSRENLSAISFYITWWDESPTLDDSPHSGFASLTTSPYKTDRFIQFSDSRQKLESACGCLASHPNSEVVNSVGKMSQFLPPLI